MDKIMIPAVHFQNKLWQKTVCTLTPAFKSEWLLYTWKSERVFATMFGKTISLWLFCLWEWLLYTANLEWVVVIKIHWLLTAKSNVLLFKKNNEKFLWKNVMIPNVHFFMKTFSWIFEIILFAILSKFPIMFKNFPDFSNNSRKCG